MNNVFSYGSKEEYVAYILAPDLRNPSKADLIEAFANHGYVSLCVAPVYAMEKDFMLGNHIRLLVQITGLSWREGTGELQYEGDLDNSEEGLLFHVFGNYDIVNRSGTISSLDERFDPTETSRVRGENAVSIDIDDEDPTPAKKAAMAKVGDDDFDPAKFDQMLRSAHPDV